MPVYMLGSGGAQAPFNRTFFNVTLGDLLQKAGREKSEKSQKLLLFLADGTALDVCSIDELADDYIAVRSYRASEETCDLSVNLIPYNLIYRIELLPKETENSTRLGFHWAPPPRRATTLRKPK